MNDRKTLFIALGALIVGAVLSACIPAGPTGACTFTATADMTVYRLPDASSDVFGTIEAGDTYEVLAATADGWVGFDPGVAQAANVGLARLRWVQLSASATPSCVADVDLVSLADVQADLEASG